MAAEIRNRLHDSLTSITRELDEDSFDFDRIDGLQYRLDWLYNTAVRFLDLGVIDDRVVRSVQQARDCLVRCQGSSPGYVSTLCRMQEIFSGERGRPKMEIPKEQLEFLVEKRFSAGDIAKLFSVSKRTVERRLNKFGISVRASYAPLSNDELDAVVTDIISEFPNVGCKRMTGLLFSRGHRDQQTRICESMRRVNPEAVLLRTLELRLIQRRSYHVQGPLSLWHLDGNHKLIRYIC